MRETTTAIGIGRWEPNNWEAASIMLRRCNNWKEFDNLGAMLLANEAWKKTATWKIDFTGEWSWHNTMENAAQLCDLYGAFDRTIDRCADAT